MLEFVRKEVWCMEEAEVSRSSLLSFFLNGHREDMVVLLNDGVFHQYMTYESLLYNFPGNDCFVTAGVNIFRQAELFLQRRRTDRVCCRLLTGAEACFRFFVGITRRERQAGRTKN